MRKRVLIIVFLIFLTFSGFTLGTEVSKEEHAYSAEYFNNLINAAEVIREQNQKQQNKEETVEYELYHDEEILSDDIEPFHLRVEQGISAPVYKDSFKKIESKTIIPLSNKFSFIQDTSKTRNKYNSHDYKILAGVEIQPVKFLNFSSGLETNFRGLDQNPASRKLYFTPALRFGDRVSLKFHNKINVQNSTSDHDIGLHISPFKSKFMDFGIYSGLTRKKDGRVSESINFSTNFYF